MHGRQMKSLVTMRMDYREKIATIDFKTTVLSFDADAIERGVAFRESREPQIVALR